MRKTFLVFLLTATVMSCYAQEGLPNDVQGKVLDTAGQAVENVNVRLLDAKDSVVRRAAVTDKSGVFILKNIGAGTYLISFSKEGYAKQYKTFIAGGSIVVLPPVILLYEIKDLQGVTVTAKRPLIEQMDDKVIYNTESDPLAATETAIDLLRKVPMITVDGQGNIQLNGQTSFKVLLNGRETSMFARNVSEVLRAFPGKLILKIEVSNSPSAKYDAEGVGGIINIITKKKVAGYNGTLSTTAATTGFRIINGSLNFKYGKLGINGFVTGGGNFNQPDRTHEEILSKNPVAFYKRITNGSSERTNTWQSGNLEVSYELDSLNTLSSYVTPTTGKNKSDASSFFDLVLPNQRDTIHSTYLSLRDNNNPSVSVGLDYIRKFKNNSEKEFSIKLNGNFELDRIFATSAQNSISANRFIINNSKASNSEYTVQADYLHPITKTTKLEAGGKLIIRKATSGYESMIRYSEADAYKINPSNTDYFSYNQRVNSLYASLNHKAGKNTSLRAGVRMENTTLNGDFTSSLTRVEQNYITILPNILLTTKFSKGQTLSLSYGMRIARPYVWNLNPFVNNTDSLVVSKGNPALQPQTFHTVSIQYRFALGPSFLSLGLTNSFSNNKIIQFSTFDDITGITTTAPANVGRNNQTTFNVSINGKFGPRWTVNGNGRLAYDIVKNATGTVIQQNQGFSGNAFFNSSYNFTSKMAASGYFGFNRTAPTLQGTYGFNIFYGLGASYKMLNDKLLLNLSVVNFHTGYFTQTNVFEDDTFKRVSQYSYQFRGLQCSISWSFGKLSENVSKKRGVTNDDLLSK